MRTACSSPYRESLPDRDPTSDRDHPGQRPLDRDPTLNRDRWTETPWTETPLDRDPLEGTWDQAQTPPNVQ